MKLHRVVSAVSALILLLVFSAPILAQETAEELYQSGLYQEEVQGNLDRAIDLFGRILIRFPDNRAVGARAQLHIGLCYEKLGQQEAQQAYRRVIADFPDHASEVAVARDRLADIERSLAELNRQPTFRKIEIASKPQNGVLSPEGSKLAFTSEGSVWVVPLGGNVGPDIAGEPIRLTEPMGVHGIGLSWSANGEWIAFNAEQEDEQGIYVIPASGGEPRRIPGNHFRGALTYSYRLSLSPDGKTLAFALHDPEAETEASPYNQVLLSIYTTPVEGGQPALLTPIWSIEPAFSPDGRFIAYVKFQSVEDGEVGEWHQELWLISTTGGTPVLVAESTGAMMPVWSPDSRMIAFAEGQEIWVVPISEDGAPTGALTKIQLPLESYGLVAGWTSHDELGVFMNAPTHQAVYTVPAQGGKAVQVSPEGPAFHPRWTPDGKSIVYRGGNRFSFAATPSDGGEVRDIPIVSDAEITPGTPGGGVHVSPDGGKIVF
ncbi:MAG: tetratricopeptide repeat protein, partial [Longimicrobiales bacterium]|nr:tetratricopeptide repeat protein [Longimicrobiales bacterium]